MIARSHELVGRGHAERLIPMLAEFPDGGRARHILVDIGPGSFTGVRVGVAAARALGLAWGATVKGYSSLALLAAAAFARDPVPALVATLEGGHGEVFMQGFASPPLVAVDALVSRSPAEALTAIGERVAIGEGTRRLAPFAPGRVFTAALPDAADVMLLPPAFRALAARPIYGRAPDAKLPVG